MSNWHGGKGDKNRTANYKAYTSNYDKIFEKRMGREKLQWDVYAQERDGVDLLEDDVIEWIKLDKSTVEIVITEECFSVGEASARGGLAFTVPTEVFNTKYKPAFK